MLLKGAVLSILLLLQFWIPAVHSAVSYQDLQYREYIDELMGRHDADDSLAPFEHTPRGLEAQRAALLAVREAIEDELEVLLARQEGVSATINSPQSPQDVKNIIKIRMYMKHKGDLVLAVEAEVTPGYTLEDLQRWFVQSGMKGKKSWWRIRGVTPKASSLTFEYEGTPGEWVKVEEGLVPEGRTKFLVTWNP